MDVQIIQIVSLQDSFKVYAAQQLTLAEPKLIGQNDSGKDIYLKNGRFGPYLQFEKEIDVVEEKKRKEKIKKRR